MISLETISILYIVTIKITCRSSLKQQIAMNYLSDRNEPLRRHWALLLTISLHVALGVGLFLSADNASKTDKTAVKDQTTTSATTAIPSKSVLRPYFPFPLRITGQVFTHLPFFIIMNKILFWVVQFLHVPRLR